MDLGRIVLGGTWASEAIAAANAARSVGTPSIAAVPAVTPVWPAAAHLHQPRPLRKSTQDSGTGSEEDPAGAGDAPSDAAPADDHAPIPMPSLHAGFYTAQAAVLRADEERARSRLDLLA